MVQCQTALGSGLPPCSCPAVAMWRCCACGREWQALPLSEQHCCAFAPCLLAFGAAPVRQNSGTWPDHGPIDKETSETVEGIVVDGGPPHSVLKGTHRTVQAVGP
mmetsp:Transcript_29712/g.81824  ORF Transcript_29712/g.81824 Transcript_29712/m.81824 type:complete len:105 (-) Transcript_29712:248-562(-)